MINLFDFFMYILPYIEKINKFEGEIKAHENINIDLMKITKMLEFCLRQERSLTLILIFFTYSM